MDLQTKVTICLQAVQLKATCQTCCQHSILLLSILQYAIWVVSREFTTWENPHGEFFNHQFSFLLFFWQGWVERFSSVLTCELPGGSFKSLSMWWLQRDFRVAFPLADFYQQFSDLTESFSRAWIKNASKSFPMFLKKLILSLIPFTSWTFLLCVLVYLRGSQTAVSDMTSWICIPFKRDI